MNGFKTTSDALRAVIRHDLMAPERPINGSQNVPLGDASRPLREAGRERLLDLRIGQARESQTFQTPP